MAEFKMPSLGADMAAGTLVEWLIKPGQAVKRGDVVAIVETDKGNIDIEIWQAGVIEELRVTEGATVPVATVLATLRDEGAPVTTPMTPVPTPMTPVPTPSPVPTPTPAAAVAAAPSAPRASPAARRLARERGVDLARLRGSGPEGAIVREDVERATARPPAEGMRRAIAAAMARSKREIPHYYVSLDVDVSRLEAWLAAENEQRPIAARLLQAAPLLKATAVALTRFPELNGYFVDGAFQPGASVHLGFAIATREGGLVTPALRDADRKSVGEIMVALADLITRARHGGLRSSELSEGTFTVTSLGERGADSVQGIIYPPQVALLGLGRTTPRPWAVDGLIGIRPVLTLTLAADHRVSDGHRGGLFLRALEDLLTHPEQL